MTTRKTFVENLQDGRAAMERVLENLTDARSSFWLAAEESKIEVNQIYLEKLVDLLSRELLQLDFEKARLAEISFIAPTDRTIASCLCFMLDDDAKHEADYRITEESAMELLAI